MLRRIDGLWLARLIDGLIEGKNENQGFWDDELLLLIFIITEGVNEEEGVDENNAMVGE